MGSKYLQSDYWTKDFKKYKEPLQLSNKIIELNDKDNLTQGWLEYKMAHPLESIWGIC